MRAPAGDRSTFLLEVYYQLHNFFGPRHWWPAETPLEVCVGAILTQNVAWRNVEKAIANLREKGFLEWTSLRMASSEDLQPLIVSTRFYKTKARKLVAFVHFVDENYGCLNKMVLEELDALRPKLLKVWGLGPETVDSILLYAAQKPTFVVDAYTKRIFSRLGYITLGVTYEDLRAFFQESLPRDVPLYNEYHALIVSLGHWICLNQKPRCNQCPLQSFCLAEVDIWKRPKADQL